ncbi:MULTISPECIES: hypothetical protein [Rhizobium]|uniref:Uncharacterized protein n=1 Tax=Rhizobium favelukesii TaxID=348824 RepID=W6RI79_9HYPH|nr:MULTISPECIES: hypothetical protein [Rhizobium]MCS0463764.1 hypothetical protein [Rhizobium favelukesii]UFS84906.1 hypothetical protein LPB79_30905 [Rhizobium sp. T136]CDM60544.1 hypothetical protein LPU83_pLPU83b_0564 [Rhizobium favelukesii]
MVDDRETVATSGSRMAEGLSPFACLPPSPRLDDPQIVTASPVRTRLTAALRVEVDFPKIPKYADRALQGRLMRTNLHAFGA